MYSNSSSTGSDDTLCVLVCVACCTVCAAGYGGLQCSSMCGGAGLNATYGSPGRAMLPNASTPCIACSAGGQTVTYSFLWCVTHWRGFHKGLALLDGTFRRDDILPCMHVPCQALTECMRALPAPLQQSDWWHPCLQLKTVRRGQHALDFTCMCCACT